MSIPTFLHIPRCGGTYILGLIMRSVALKYRGTTKTITLIHVMQGAHTTMRAFVVSDKPLLGSTAGVVPIPNRVAHISLEQNLFFKEAQKHSFEICVLIIEARGAFQVYRGLFHSLNECTGSKLVKGCLIRNPYSRALSLFLYLKGIASKHELTHGAIKAETFSEYINSEQLEDSWLIRAILNIPNSKPIEDGDVDETYRFFDEFIIADIQATDLFFNKMMECRFSTQILNAIDRSTVYFNKSSKKVVNISEGDLKTFTDRTVFDQRLYDRLLNRDRLS